MRMDQEHFVNLTKMVDNASIMKNLIQLKAEAADVEPLDREINQDRYFVTNTLDRDTIMENIRVYLNDIDNSTLVDLPKRGKNCLEYNTSLKCRVFKKKLTQVGVLDKRVRCFKEILTICQDVLRNDSQMSKRELYYTGYPVFEDHNSFEMAISDATISIGCTLENLCIIPSPKGKIIGDLRILNPIGEPVSCARQYNFIHSSPARQVQFWRIEYPEPQKFEPLFLLIVEHDAAFQRLICAEFHIKYKCLMITGCGVPDTATRLFANFVCGYFKIPVLGLFDNDVGGMTIMGVYAHGCSSYNAHDNHKMVLQGLRWLGMKPASFVGEDLESLSDGHLSSREVTRAHNLGEDVFTNNEWKTQLLIMISRDVKTRISSLNRVHINYLTHYFLPMEMQNRNWPLI